ncbi:MAG: M28 family metallopeptidase [Bacillus sp. (in: firmicutes)]
MRETIMNKIAVERAVGSPANHEILDYLETELEGMGFDVQSLPFKCTVWETEPSCLTIHHQSFDIKASPFSEPFEGRGTVKTARTFDELQRLDCTNSILILAGDLTSEPLQPKNYPFYFPDEHRKLIELVEQKQPLAVIAVTGKHSLCGLEPFPLFEDGNFLIPSGYMSEAMLAKIESDAIGSLSIRSKKTRTDSRQLVATKKAKKSAGKIVICAHMDSKYQTLGALDNAVGVVTLLEVANNIQAEAYDIEVVPFNSEEYYEASGEVAYLQYVEDQQDDIVLVVNMDSPCHKGSEIAVSLYNVSPCVKSMADRLLSERNGVVYGPEWFAGDHAPFTFQGIPCLAITSSDLFNGALAYTHTMKDTISTVDLDLVGDAANYINDFVSALSHKEKERRNQLEQ